jgi:hypothetical protein
MEYYGEDALEGQNPNTEKDTIYYAAAQKENQLSSLLNELGGDNPQNRAIAEGLQKQGISSTQDILVEKVFVPGYSYGSDESAGSIPDSTRNVYFNKTTGQEINPNRLGIIQNGTAGVKDGDIFFHLNADDQGNVKFEPEWSPRSHGFLRDNPIGQLIMKAGAIIPSIAQPFFVAANVGDALAHEKYAKALLNVLPYAAQEFGVTDAIKGALGLGGYSGLDMGDVIPQGGIAEHLPAFAPTDVYNWSESINTKPYDNWASTIGETTLDDIIGNLQQGSVDPLTANNITDVSGNYLRSEIDTIKDMANATPESGEANPSFGLDINDNYFTSGTPGEPGALPVNWEPTDIDDIARLSTDNVGSDWSAGNPTTGYPNADPNNPNKVLDPTKDFMGRPISDELTLDKAADLGKAYLDNPAALAGLVGAGLATTGLVNSVIESNQSDKKVEPNESKKPVVLQDMVKVGSTPGLQDLFDYTSLYKDSPFFQQQTTQQPQLGKPVYPEFTVSDVFRSLMKEAPPQPKIEPNLVGLADLQKKMMVGR